MNTKLRQKAKNNFEKGFFKLMNNAVFGEKRKNERNHRIDKLVTTERRRTIQYQNQIIIVQSFLQKIFQQQK